MVETGRCLFMQANRRMEGSEIFPLLDRHLEGRDLS